MYLNLLLRVVSKVSTSYKKDIVGKDYQALIELASKKCDKFALVVRKDMFENDELAMKFYNKTLGDIQNSLIEMKEQSEWAVTKLSEVTAYICYYEINEQTKHFLKTKSDSLFGWNEKLPEDLMYYSGDKVWLAVNSHESYFFVDEEFENCEDLKNLLLNA